MPVILRRVPPTDDCTSYYPQEQHDDHTNTQDEHRVQATMRSLTRRYLVYFIIILRWCLQLWSRLWAWLHLWLRA